MVYPAGTPIKTQVLDQLATQLGAIATPGFHHDVRSAKVYGGQHLALGRSMPAIVIVPSTEEVLRYLTCQRVEMVMNLDVHCAIRVSTEIEDWRNGVVWLLADVRKAINDDIQLSSLALYTDLVDEDVADEIDSNLAVGRLGIRVAYRHDFDDPNT